MRLFACPPSRGCNSPASWAPMQGTPSCGSVLYGRLVCPSTINEGGKESIAEESEAQVMPFGISQGKPTWYCL